MTKQTRKQKKITFIIKEPRAKYGFDLEERTLRFAKNIIDLCRQPQRDFAFIEIAKQLIRAAGSVGANYREANDAGSRKEFYYRIGLCRREAKECSFWLELLEDDLKTRLKVEALKDEAIQLTKIFAAIFMRQKRVQLRVN